MTTKKLNNKVEKLCCVCGDKAIARNFGAITCESCKAFFRRAAVKNKVLKCSFENNCQIEPKNRKSCKKCRLVKCYASGMKRELIVKRPDRQPEEIQKRQRKDTNASNDSSISLPSLTTEELIFDLELSNLSPEDGIESSKELDRLFNSNDFEALMENCCLNDGQLDSEIMEFENFLNQLKNAVKSVESDDRSSLAVIVRPIATFDKDFNYIEINRLTELKKASDGIHDFSGSSKYCIKLQSVKEVISKFISLNIFERKFESLIKFCKSVGPFKEVCESDQIALIKNSFGDILNLKFFTRFNLDEQYIDFVLNDEYSFRCCLNVFELEDKNSWSVCGDFFRNFPKEWQCDTTLLNLMMAIALFNHETPKLMHNQIVKLHQQLYMYLLQRYLIIKFRSEDKSSEDMSRALQKLMELHKMGEFTKEMFKKQLDFVSPLVGELFDINNDLN